MMDPCVQLLIEHAVDSPTKLHLLLIFHENPRLEATPTQIAERSCRDIWSITQALDELAEDGILACNITRGSDQPLYSYLPRHDYLEPIRKLICGYDDPLERDMLHRSIRDRAGYASFRRASGGDYWTAVAY
ncbi:MAG: hypothetical protein MI924_00370 [Chloroflexales bacterium]|nr:hypothetical protein [Chloroflexales bacterium]